MITYEATFHIDWAKAIPAVGDVVNRINDHLSKMGVHEQLGVRGEAFSFSLSVNRELTNEEQYKMKRLLEAQVIERFQGYDVRLASFGRQPGNVLQSAA